MACANRTFIGLALLFVILHLICEADENPLDKGQARQRNKRKFPQKDTTSEGFYKDGDPFSSPVNMFGSRPQFWLFGDSITERATGPTGWGSLLGHFYSRKVDVINRGYSGYNSKHALSMLRQFEPSQPSSGSYKHILVTVFFGANDMCDRSVAWQGVPLGEYEENTRQMVRLLREKLPGVAVVVIAPPAFEPKKFRKSRSNESAKKYADAAVKVAKEEDVMYIDTHSRMSSQENWGSLLIDGLHFSDAGQKFLFDQIVDLLGSDERAANFRSLRPQFPNYSRLDKVESPDVSIEKICQWPNAFNKYCVLGRNKSDVISKPPEAEVQVESKDEDVGVEAAAGGERSAEEEAVSEIGAQAVEQTLAA